MIVILLYSNELGILKVPFLQLVPIFFKKWYYLQLLPQNVIWQKIQESEMNSFG